jgi:hypothetical protein
MHYKSGKIFFLNSFFAYLLALFLGTAVFAFWAEQADARAFVEATKVGQNVNGFGWSSNYGWVSFNSDACDANGDGTADNTAVCAQPSAAINQYGVNIQYISGRLDGLAWSEHVGWVSFNADYGASTTYNHISGSFIGKAVVAIIDDSIEDVYGATARAGDLYLYGGTAAVTAINNQLSPNYGELRGWAWNSWNGGGTANPALANGVGLGWLSFSSLNCDADDNGVIDNTNCGEVGATRAIYNVVANLNRFPTVANSQMWRVAPLPEDQILPGDGAGPNLEVISVGDRAEFRMDWTDDDLGDGAKLIVCRNSTAIPRGVFSGANTAPTGLAAARCSGAASETWCTSGITTTKGQLTCQHDMLETDGLGGVASNNNRFYASICDQYGYCTSMTSEPFLLNDRPKVNDPDADAVSGDVDGSSRAVVTAPPLTAQAPDGTWNDHLIDFDADWEDDFTRGTMSIYVCGTNDFDYDHNSLGCADGVREWCSSTTTVGAAISGNVSCSGQTNATDTTGLRNFYVFMCDGYNACTPEAESATGQFIINARPKVATGPTNGMSAPNWNASQAATNPLSDSDLKANLRWVIDDSLDGALATGMTNAYLNVRGSDGSNRFGTSTFAGNPLGVGACNNFNCFVRLDERNPRPVLGMLNWSTSYRWTAWVHDAYAWSEPLVYDHSAGGVLTDDVAGAHYGDYGVPKPAAGPTNTNKATNDWINRNAGGNNFTFTTFKHNFPIVNQDAVSYFPAKPSAGEEVKATANGKYYTNNIPARGANGIESLSVLCPLGTCSYDWDTNAILPATSVGDLKHSDNTWHKTLFGATAPAIMRFLTEGTNQDYTLTIIDQDGYFNSSSSTRIQYVNERLPSWQEVK